jgi:hypothetical protein
VSAGSGYSLRGLHDERATSDAFFRVVGLGAGEHVGELRHREPPGPEGDGQEHQARGCETFVEHTVLLRSGGGPHLVLVVSSAVDGQVHGVRVARHEWKGA